MLSPPFVGAPPYVCPISDRREPHASALQLIVTEEDLLKYKSSDFSLSHSRGRDYQSPSSSQSNLPQAGRMPMICTMPGEALSPRKVSPR